MLKRAIVRTSAIYLFSNVLNAAIPFLLLPLLTRVLPPAEYGKIAVFQAILAALVPFMGSSWCSAATRKYYDLTDQPAELADFIGACIQLVFGAVLAGLLIAWTFDGPVSRWLSIPPYWLVTAIIASAAIVVAQVRLDQWQVRKKAGRYGAFQVSQSACNMLLSLFLVLALHEGAQGRIMGQTYAAAAFGIIAISLLWKDRLIAFGPYSPKYMKEALAFGLPLIPHLVGIFLLNAADRVVITSELGLRDAGVYLVAAQLAGALGLVFDAVNKAYIPWLFERLSRGNPAELAQIVRYTYAWFLLLALAAGLVAAVGPLAVSVIAGDEYRAAGRIIGWLAVGQAFVGAYCMVTNYVFYVRRTGLLSTATIAAGGINVVLLLFLVRTWGLEGAAIAFAISMAVRFILVWWLAHRLHPMPWLKVRALTLAKSSE